MPEGLIKLTYYQSKYDGHFMMVGKDSKKPVRRPTGSYDKTILCRECDNKLGRYDSAVVDFCKRDNFKTYSVKGASFLPGVDKKKLKLFAMSYIWRASITTLSEYSTVNLGDKHEARIASMLCNDDAGSLDDYSVIIKRFSLPEEKKGWGNILLNPATSRIDGINVVDIYLPNLYKWTIKVDSRPFNEAMRDMSLGAVDEALIFDGGDYVSSPEFSLLREIVNNSQQ